MIWFDTQNKPFNTTFNILDISKRKTKVITFISAILLCSNGFAQVQDKTKNTPKTLLELSNKHSKTASWFTEMPQFNSDSSLYYAEKAFKLLDPNEPLHQSRYQRLAFERMKKRNKTYSLSIQDSLAQIEWSKIKNLEDNDDDKMLNFDYLVYWSNLNLKKGDRKTSLELFSQALKKIEIIDNPDLKAQINLKKGLYYGAYGLPEEKKLSLKYIHNSLNYYKKIDVSINPEKLYMIYAELIYHHTGNNQDSIYFYYDKVKSVLNNYKKPLAHIWYYTMYSYELIQQAKENSNNLNTFNEAKENVLKATDIMKTYNMENNSYYPYSFELLAEIDFNTKNYTNALHYYKKANSLYSNLNDNYHATKALSSIGETYKEIGDFANAIKYKEQFYDESLKYEKERNARSLLEKELQLDIFSKEKSLVKKSNQQVILIIILVIGVIAYFLFYQNYKLKKKNNIKLEKLNHELHIKNRQNELLLKEIHHRVKNNLELVKSLISLQSAQLEDSATKDAMIASQNRVQSMGIIHQKLYQGENLGSIEMKDYFLNLGEGILDTFNKEEKVKIECAMENLELDVDTAVPIGLIVNELLTNALKYAFPEDANGNIKISLSKSNPETLTLKVSDNGIGKTIGLAPKGTGFGSQLIQLLTQQLNGIMTEETENGTSVLFHFKLNTAA
jgi:two-component sensor histidine kinase